MARSLTAVAAASLMVLSGALVASPSFADDEAAPIGSLVGSQTHRFGVDGAADNEVAARAGKQCYFNFNAYYRADRNSIAGPTSENIRGEVEKDSGNCKAVYAKTSATVRISHTSVPLGNVVKKSGSKTATEAPFFASVTRQQMVPTGYGLDYHGPGTQITFDFVWRLSAKNGNYLEFCRRVTGQVNATSVSKNGDTGLKSCGGGKWK